MRIWFASKQGDLVAIAGLLAVAIGCVGRGLLPGWGFSGLDWTDFLYPLYEFSSSVFSEEGRLPFWNPHIFSGMPHLVSLNSYILYPTELASLVFRFEPSTFYALDFVFHLWVAGTGLYVWLRWSGLSRAAAMTGALCYIVGGGVSTLVGAGHARWLRGMAWLPWVFLCIERGNRDGGMRWYARAGALLALPVLTASVDFVVYALLFVAGIMAFSGNGTRRERLLRFACLSVTLAGLSAVTWVPGVEYYLNSVRVDPSLSYAKQWPWTFWDSLTFLVPDLFGRPGVYFGPHAFRATTEYMGILPLFLCFVGIKASWRLERRWIVVAAVAAILALAPSTPLAALLAHVPVYSGMRGSIRWLSFVHIAACLFVAHGWDHMWATGVAWRRRGGVLLLFVAVICAFLFLAHGPVLEKITSLSFVETHMRTSAISESDVAGVIANALGRTSVATGVASGILLLGALPAVPVWLVAGLAWTHIAGDMYTVASPYYSYERMDASSHDDEVVSAIKRIETLPPTQYRVASNEYLALPNRRMSAGLQWIFGYHGLPLLRYIQLYMNTKAPYPAMQVSALRILNVKYLVSPHRPSFDWPVRATVRSVGGEEVSIYENPSHLPRVFVPEKWIPCVNLRDVVRELRSERWTEAIVPTDSILPDRMPAASSGQNAYLQPQWGRDECKLNVVLPDRQLIVFSEPWYPAWKATIDGKRVKMLRAYGALRAVDVPAGEHKIRMFYDSWLFKIGLLMSCCAAVLVAAMQLMSDGRAGGGRLVSDARSLIWCQTSCMRSWEDS